MDSPTTRSPRRRSTRRARPAARTAHMSRKRRLGPTVGVAKPVPGTGPSINPSDLAQRFHRLESVPISLWIVTWEMVRPDRLFCLASTPIPWSPVDPPRFVAYDVRQKDGSVLHRFAIPDERGFVALIC
jgi:hypothetical protein